MEYDSMLREPNDNSQSSVFRFDSYPGQCNIYKWDMNSSIQLPSSPVTNTPMFSSFVPIQQNQPAAPPVPSSFFFGGTPADNRIPFDGQFPFQITSSGYPDQRVKLVLGKRKTDSPTLQPCKQHITEEKMAEHMSKLHISSETAMSPLEPESIKNKRLYMCEEMRKLQSEPLLPATLVAQIQRPCTALVLWQPPAKVSTILGTETGISNSEEKNLEKEKIPKNKIGESLDMDSEIGGDMDLDT